MTTKTKVKDSCPLLTLCNYNGGPNNAGLQWTYYPGAPLRLPYPDFDYTTYLPGVFLRGLVQLLLELPASSPYQSLVAGLGLLAPSMATQGSGSTNTHSYTEATVSGLVLFPRFRLSFDPTLTPIFLQSTQVYPVNIPYCEQCRRHYHVLAHHSTGNYWHSPRRAIW